MSRKDLWFDSNGLWKFKKVAQNRIESEGVCVRSSIDWKDWIICIIKKQQAGRQAGLDETAVQASKQASKEGKGKKVGDDG